MVPVHGSIYVSPWKMISISGTGEPLGGILVGMLPGAPAGGGVITGIPNGTPDAEELVDVNPIGDGPIGTSPANVNVFPSVVIVIGDVGIGTVSEPITTPDGPITIVEPSASVIVVNVEPMGIVVPLATIAGAVPEIELPGNVNISPSVVVVVGDVGIGTVSEPITTPDGPITIVEPSASVIVLDVEPMGIVVPSATIAGVVSEIKLPGEPVVPVTVLGVCNDGVITTVESCGIVDISPEMEVVVTDEAC